MFKLILIEDDVHVLHQLEKIIMGIKSNFVIVKTFTHPLDAIEYIDNNEVDAVITDIKLPHMTGIELCEYCYNKHRNIKFAILSAYDYFEYAQKAIEFEVTHYVLKPITIAKLETALKKLSERINRKNEGFVDFNTTVSRQKVISNFLTGFYNTNEDFFADFEKCGIKTDFNCCRCCKLDIELTDFDNYLDKKNSYTKEEFYQIASVIVNRNTDDFYSVMYNNSGNKMCIFIFTKNYFDKEIFKDIITALTKTLRSDFSALLDLDNTVFKTKLFENIDEFYKSQRQSITYNEYAKNIVSQIYSGEYDLAVKCIETLPLVFNNDKHSAEMVYKCIAEHSANLMTDSQPFSGDINEMKSALISKIRTMQYNSDSDTSDTPVITKALEYIKENFTNDITLNDVANHVFLNPIYFSSFFKKKTGEKYSDYISGLKLNKAKKLLTETNMKLHSVAEKSGFKDTNYFHKIFKASTGYTPLEYRNNYRSEKSK